MNKRLQALQKARLEKIAAMEALLNGAEAARGTGALLNEEEQKRFDALNAERSELDAHVAREHILLEAQRNAPSIQVGTERETTKPFASLGEQLKAIVDAGTPGGKVDPRLFGAASGASANVGSDGGFMIQKDFAIDLLNKGQESGVLSSRCDSTELSENSDSLEVLTVDETSRANGSRWGGVRIYRRAEAETVAASRPKMGTWERKLEDMMGIAYATDRLLQDAPAMAGIFQQAFSDELGFVLDDEIFRGTGVGQCQGVVGAPSTVTQAAEGGQTADTIVSANVMKMWARVPLRSRIRGIWVYNIEVEPQLGQLQIGSGTANTLVYMPPGGLSQQPFGTIYGRPAIPIEHASAIGDVGDFAFLDLSQYKLIRKGGIQQDESIHVRFLYGERAFRWITRVNGAPKWKAPLTPYKGANTLSPFVVLAAR